MMVEGTVLLAALAAIGFAVSWRRAEHQLHRLRCTSNELQDALAAAQARARQADEAATDRREMLEALPTAVWRRRDDGGLVDCNQAYADAIGSSRNDVLAAGSGLAPERGGGADAPAGSAAFPYDVHVVIGGKRRLLQVHQAPSAGGGAIGFALDRTEVENAQAELRRHIGAHAAVLESLSAAVAIFGPDKRLDFFNTAFTVLWGLDAAWLRSRPSLGEILEHLHASRRFPEYPDFRAFKRQRCALFNSLIEPQHELMHLPDGRTLHLTISPHPRGGLTYVYDDVSDRLALECSYNTLAQVQRATLDHLFEGIAVYGGDGRLKLHNPAFRALWGLSEADVVGEPHVAVIVDKIRELLDDRGDWAGVREEMVAQVTSQTLTSGPLYRRDGSVLQVASVPLPDGEVLLTYIDVSDGVRVERVLRERNEALETAGRLKSEFVASVSHELRTPLNTVIGFGEILHNQYFGPLNASQREYSRGLLDSAHHLMVLINDAIDLASIEAGYLELECTRVDLLDMLQGVVGLSRERARSRGIEMELDFSPDIGSIEGDERRLKQALFNLISNAIKFTPPGGTIRLEAKRHDNELMLVVADSGPGVAAAGQVPNFKRFAESRGRTGSGLGLSLVKSLIEMHGGVVEIESAQGAGTRVICRLHDVLRTGDAAGAAQRRERAEQPCEVAG